VFSSHAGEVRFTDRRRTREQGESFDSPERRRVDPGALPPSRPGMRTDTGGPPVARRGWRRGLAEILLVACAAILPSAVGHAAAVIDAPPPGVDPEQLDCLSVAMYFEARGEGVYGQRAVAEVILNRRDSPSFPDTVCEVVHQGYDPANPRLHRCQFSFYCDGRPETIDDPERFPWIRAMALRMLLGDRSDLTRGALYFHAAWVSPGWARRFRKTARVEQHLFYRPE